MLKQLKVALLSVMAMIFCVLGVGGIVTVSAADIKKITTEDMIQAITNAGKDSSDSYGKVISTELFSYSIGYGKVDAQNNTVNVKPYEINNGGLRTTDVYDANKYNCSVLLTGGTARVSTFKLQEDGAQVEGNYNIIYTLTALDDIKITITHDSRNNAAANLVANTYKVTSSAITVLSTKEVPVGTVEKNYYGGTYTINNGEQLVFEFALTAEKKQVVFYGALYPDFQANYANAFSVEKEQLKTKVENAKNAVNEDDYTQADYSDIIALYNACLASVNAATTSNELTTAEQTLNSALADILNASEAIDYREKAVSNLQDYINGLDDKAYLEQTYQSICEKTTQLQTAIASLTRKNLIDKEYEKILAEIVLIQKDAPITSLSMQASEIINGVIAAGETQGEGYIGEASNQLVSYAVGYGRLFKDLESIQFNGYDVVNGGLRTSKVYNDAKYNCGVIILNGKIRVTNFYVENGIKISLNNNAIFKLTAKNNLKITVKHPAGSATNFMAVNTYKIEAGGLYKLQSTNINADYQENAYGGEWTLKTGETLYLEYDLNTAGNESGDVNHLPSFDVAVIEESEVQSVAKEPETAQDLNKTTFELVDIANEYGGVVMQANGFKWQLMHGEYTAPQSYEIVGGGVLRTKSNNSSGYASIYASNAINKFVRTDPDHNESFIIKFVAEQNVVISVTSDEWVKDTHSLGATYDIILQHYDETTDATYYYPLKNDKCSWPTTVEAGLLNAEVHLTAGDVMLYVIGGVSSGVNITFLPNFASDVKSYSLDKAFDFSAYIIAQTMGAQFKEQLQNEYDGLILNDYTTDDYLELCDIYEKAIEKTADCKTEADLDALREQTSNAVADYLKVSEVEAQRKAALDELQKAVDALDKTKYSQVNYQIITDRQGTFAQLLETLTRKSVINEELQLAIADINAVEKDVKPQSASCLSSISQLSLILVVCAGISLCTLMKKAKNN